MDTAAAVARFTAAWDALTRAQLTQVWSPVRTLSARSWRA